MEVLESRRKTVKIVPSITSRESSVSPLGHVITLYLLDVNSVLSLYICGALHS